MLRGAEGDLNPGKDEPGLLDPVFQERFTEALLMKVLVHHAPAHDHVRLLGIFGGLVDTDASATYDPLIAEHHPVRATCIYILIEKSIEQGQLLLCKVQRHVAPEDFKEPAFVFRQVWLNG